MAESRERLGDYHIHGGPVVIGLQFATKQLIVV
jgi:hypothetical protein